MRKMASRDEKQMRHIAALVKAGKIKEAYTRADCMDTVVRETIPSHFWEFAEAASRLEKTLGRSSANHFSVSLK
jgi:predicted aspartyl protease